MISKEEAFRIVMGSSRSTGTETVVFSQAAGRVLAVDVFSDMDIPPFNRSAVDGYACRKEDLGNELEITEIIQAGREPERTVGKNQCAKIMTGAIMPGGSDFVAMVEDSIILPSGKVRLNAPPNKSNFSIRGEDVREGEMVLQKGRLLKPQDIAVLASVGKVDVLVARRPLTGIISTGDEIVEPGTRPERSQIRNSNAYQLMALCERSGCTAKYYGIAPDDFSRTFSIIDKAVNENDLVILTGGVSMGDFDFVPAVMKKAGIRILFDRVNVQPGKPTTFGIHEKSIVFGLPGNPVSAFIQFETLVRPLVYKMMDHDWKPVEISFPMAERYERKAATRAAWIPVTVTKNQTVVPSEYHGSAHITAFPCADGIISIPAGKEVVEKGETVLVRFI